MVVRKLQAFFGEDWDDAFDSLKSAPGALGGVMLSTMRQLRPYDALAFSLVVAGWLWLIAGVAVGGRTDAVAIAAGVLPTILWLAAGVTGALVFEIGGLGKRVLGYWEAYVIIAVLALFGVVSLWLALNPRDLHVHRGATVASPPI
jgi:hypothetical protein